MASLAALRVRDPCRQQTTSSRISRAPGPVVRMQSMEQPLQSRAYASSIRACSRHGSPRPTAASTQRLACRPWSLTYTRRSLVHLRSRWIHFHPLQRCSCRPTTPARNSRACSRFVARWATTRTMPTEQAGIGVLYTVSHTERQRTTPCGVQTRALRSTVALRNANANKKRDYSNN